MTMRFSLASLLAALLALGAATAEAAARKAAVLPFEIIVDQYDPEVIPIAKPAEKKRLLMLADELKQLLNGSGQYAIVDEKPLAKEIDDKSPFYKCNGCEADIAKKLDAELAVTGLVQKQSENALNISVQVRGVADGNVIKTVGVTVLENTDDGWVRGLRRVVKSRLLDEDQKK